MSSLSLASLKFGGGLTPSRPALQFAPEHVVTLCASALFSGLSPQEGRQILSCGKMRRFLRDEIIHSEGDSTKSVALIHSGTVKLTQVGPSGDEVLLWMSGPGDALGLPAAGRDCYHTCSAKAVEHCRAWVWDYNQLESLLIEYPEIRRNITRIMSGRLQELEERFRELATERVAKRLALTLQRLLSKVGKETLEGIEVALSREELAQMTGTTLFTISRIISKWAEEGFVIPKRQAIVIKDAKKLATVEE